MRKFYFLGLLLSLASIAMAQTPKIVISQVYGGGGNSGATYKNDFIEIFNAGTTTVDLSGWSVQYASAAGTSWQKTDLSGSIAPGQYYLIQQAAGTGGTVPLPTPDATGNIAMSGTAAKVALVNSTVALTGACPTVVDFVGFGAANCSETAPTATLSNSTAAIRNEGGCTDTNDNSADFSVAAPTPRNSASPLNVCGGTTELIVSVSAGSNAAEPSTTGSFIINLSQPAPTGGISLDYAYSGTATAGIDFTDAGNGSITIAAGATTGTINLPVIDDNDIEGSETITITISNAAAPAIIGTATATIDLVDNDLTVSPYIQLTTSYTQDFNTLASTGTSSTLPTGWLFSETGTNANTTYTAGTGSGTGGDTYSFGNSTDRAFGGLLSGSLTPTIGAQIENTSGNAITKLKIDYTGEQWRLGTAGRQDLLSFQYSTDATNLATGTWINVTALDFSTPNTAGTAGLRDGNAAAYRTSVSYIIRGLNIPAGATFMIRWNDFNASGSDDGLAIDDFSIEANPIDITPPAISTLSPANGALDVSLTTTLTATFNEPVVKGSGTINLRRLADNSIVSSFDIASADVTVSANMLQLSVTGLLPNTAYYLEIPQGAVTDSDVNAFAGTTGSETWNFTTGTTMYVAGFQNCGTSLSDGFTQFSIAGAQVWACTPFGRDPNNPAGTAQFPTGIQINGFASGTNVVNEDWLISPSFDLTGTTYPLLSFWSRVAFNGQPLQLKVSTDYTSGDPSAANWTDVNGRFPSANIESWTLSENINLTAYKGSNVHFAFVYYSSDEEGARWTLDDIKLSNSPTPPPPSLTLSTPDIDFAYAAANTTSDKEFSLTGNDIVNPITVTATGDFLVSKDGSTFVKTIELPVEEANNNTINLFARFAPTQNNQTFAGYILVNSGNLKDTVQLTGSSIDPATTLEVVNWNIEWFGSPTLGPTNDDLQQQNIQKIVKTLNADVYALAEVVSEERLAAIVNQMPGYAYVISNYGSHTNTNEAGASPLSEAQKLAFIYRTDILSNVTTQALLSQGINSAEDLTNPAYNYFASGRFPYMMSADVTLNCVTRNVKFVLLHAKANTSPTNISYQRRESGADTLHYTLQKDFADDNIILLGDYNDDLDSTITAGINPKITSYHSFTDDVDNFTAVTLPLSLEGKKSTVAYNDVIDHVTISNDLASGYLPNSARILTDVTGLVTNYGSTTTDHYPVLSRYRFANTTAPVFDCLATVSFCMSANNEYTIPVTSATDDCGDEITFSYSITGATTRTGTGNNASGLFNEGQSIITWTATDEWGNSSTCQTTVTIFGNPTVTIADAYALASGTLPNTVYPAYKPAASITLTASATGGGGTYGYDWTSGSTVATTTVSPTTTTSYAVTVTDLNGCIATASKTINVIDISAGNKGKQVTICHNGMTLRVGQNEVAIHLAHGDMLGACAGDIANARKANPAVDILEAKAWPNPSSTRFSFAISGFETNEKVSLKVTDQQGKIVEQRQNLLNGTTIQLGENFKPGVYFAELVQGDNKKTLRLVKL